MIGAMIAVVAIFYAFLWWRSTVHHARSLAGSRAAAMLVVEQLHEGYKMDLQDGDAERACTKAGQISDIYSEFKEEDQARKWRELAAGGCSAPKSGSSPG